MQGVVMDIKKNKAVIFQKNGAIVEVPNRSYEIGQEITINPHPYRKYMLVAACFLLCFVTGISGYALYNTPYDYIYVDINPSLRLDINYFERVISVVPLNDDASDLMANYHFTSSDAETCINDIVKACREKNYLNSENSNVELDVASQKNDLSRKVDNVSNILKKENLEVSVAKINKEENTKAIKYSTSPKRLKAIEDYTNVFGGTLAENMAALKGVSTKNIYAEIEKSKKSSENKQRTDINPNSSSKSSTGEGKKQQSGITGTTSPTNKNTVNKDTAKDNGTVKSEQESKNPEETSETPEQRLNAIKEYTKIFGGDVAENTAALEGISTKEIHAAIREKQANKSDTEKKTTYDTQDNDSVATDNKPDDADGKRKKKEPLPSENADTAPSDDGVLQEIPSKTED